MLLALGSENLVVFLGQNNVLWVLVAEQWAHRVGNVLQKQVDREGDEGNEEAVQPLRACQTILVHLHEPAEELHANDLEHHDDGPDDEEGRVAKDALEDVYLVRNLS